MVTPNQQTGFCDQQLQNRLAHEKSPYLLQHADNPVDWFPWGAEAFAKARRENKPIFLSIGYSTCHWCHVMAHESFEDAEVARLMNEVFVCIKVDREERPDIDGVFMRICQMLTGQGGWPLTIIMTPDKKPFFAGTYIPKTSRFGRTGMVELTQRVQQLWSQQPDKLLQTAQQVTAALQQTSQNIAGDELTEEVLSQAFRELADRFDERYGGFGAAPKFPTPHNLNFLLRYGRRSGDEKALEMTEATLQAMRRGGIYDHISFGFHRYSTDQKWLTPHFEKMLYDQALLAWAYLETYQVTQKAEYAQTAREIFTYVLRDMTDPAGGFYSAEDADSEGEEGKFYLWTDEQIREVLNDDQAELVIKVFNVEAGGNFAEEATGARTGANILHLTQLMPQIAQDLNLTEQQLRQRLDAARQQLFDARAKRIRPYKDDKILTDWNGLMIAALAKGARVLDNDEYARAAKKAADFILKNMTDDQGRLLHRWRQGQAGIPAHLDDYSFMVWGLLELYETTFEVPYLQKALELNRDTHKHFWDDTEGGFYFTADDGEELLVRQKEIYDGAVPSGNSVALLNLLRIGRITVDADLETQAAALVRTFSQAVQTNPSAYTQMISGVDFALGPAYEIVIVGETKAPDTLAILKTIRGEFIPNKVVLLRPDEQPRPEIIRLAPFTKLQTSIDGQATAYICHNYTCEEPTTDTRKILELLK
ncbi:thioredoxin domain-containing protein [Planctomycetota bacterium]